MRGGTDRIGSAYRVFRSRLQAVDDSDDPADIQRFEEAVIGGLALVSVTAQGLRERLPELRVAQQHRAAAQPG